MFRRKITIFISAVIIFFYFSIQTIQIAYSNNLISQNAAKSMTTRQINTKIKYITQINGTKEYSLSNGLKVLLKSNHSIPLITFSVWYKVGSRNEHDGIYGLAHFLEHMMFKGTSKFKKGQISEIIQNHGGIFNAFTSSDGTTYYETISPKYLEKVIEIESDRLKGSLIDQNELNLERSVVLSELEGDLNNPTSLLDQSLRFTAYERSPYKHPTIGYEKDIKNIDSKIMKEFYNKYYNPNNATIVLVGDFGEKNALNLISKYFGNIKNSSEITDYESIPRDDSQNKEKKTTVKRAGTFKILEIAYHIPEVNHADIYPLNIIEEILIKGEKSPLNQILVENGLATEVYGGAEANKDPGLFYILVSLTPKATHKQIENIITSEINNLIKNPPSEEEILAAKNRIKASYLFNLDGPFNQALNIGYFETINNWKQSIDWTDKISKVTKEDIQYVLKTYFKKENRTLAYFIPKIQKGDKYEAVPLSLERTHHYLDIKDTKTKFNSPVKSKTKPKSTKSKNQYQPKKIQLTDESTLILYKNIDIPITYISGVIEGGSSLLPKEKDWDCEIISRTLIKGSKKYPKEEIERIIDTTGSQINFSCDEESFKFNIASLNDNLLQTIDLFTDLLFNPTFPAKIILNEKNKLIAEIIELKDNTQQTARRRFSQLIYPEDHPYYSNSFDKDIKLIKTIDRKDLLLTHNILIRKNKALLSLLSNIKDNELNRYTKRIENSFIVEEKKIESKANIPDVLLRDDIKKESIFINDKMQSDVFLGHAGNIKRTDPDFYKIYIANHILGGSSLSSRLSKKVRDESGLVYTIYSYVNATHGKGEFGIYFGSNNNNVDKAIELVKAELKDFVKNGITEAELQKTKASLIDSFAARNLSTNRTVANTLLGIEFYNLGKDYIHDYPKIINSIKLSEVNSVIKKYIYPDKLNIVIAGQYKQQKEQISQKKQ